MGLKHGFYSRTMRWGFSLTGAGAAYLYFSAPAAVAEARPNVLFILSDDLGWGDPSCYGNHRFKTPSLDRLASQGILFTQFYQGASVCSPSRASLLTGRWPGDVGIHGYLATTKLNQERGMPDFLDPKIPTLPGLLRQAGYTTVHIGKWHLGYPERSQYQDNWSLYPENADHLLSEYGFDLSRWVDARDRVANIWSDRPHASERLVDETCSVLENLKKSDKPFFCQLWLIDPHAALAPSDEQMAPFKRGVPKGFTSPFMVYAATVTEMDRQIGRLLDKLDELGLTDNTVVVFSSDNGPEDICISNASWSGIGSAGPL
ncbi:MAG: sulfatase, partial [Kiritimatiellales bacterium]